MPFEEITHIKISKYGKTAGKPLSKTIVRRYKKALNDIAESGVDTIQKLVDDVDFVITLIDGLAEKSRDDLHEKRVYYSAVFYALDQRPNEDKKGYYDAFQQVKDRQPGEYKKKE